LNVVFKGLTFLEFSKSTKQIYPNFDMFSINRDKQHIHISSKVDIKYMVMKTYLGAQFVEKSVLNSEHL